MKGTAGCLAAIALALAACGGGSPSTAALVDRLGSGDAKAQAKAAETLAAQVDPSVATAIDRQARTSASAAAGRDLYRGDLLAIYRGEPSGSPQRTAVVGCLARLRDAGTTDALVGLLLADRSSSVQDAALAALVPRAPLAADVRARVTHALDVAPAQSRAGRLEQLLAAGGTAEVRALLPRLTDTAWARAVVARVGLPSLPYLRERLRHGGRSVQIAASLGLLELRKQHAARVAPLIPAIVAAMLPQLGGSPFSGVADVLAGVGKPAVDRLVAVKRKEYSGLSPAEQHVWQFADATLADMWASRPASVASVVSALRRRDYALIATVDQFFVSIGIPGSEKVLADALNARGGSAMALDFILSGNGKLDRAGRDWAARNGYTVTGSGTTDTWGAARTRPGSSAG